MTKKELFLGLALFMAFLLFVGTAGAREAGNISFYQFVAQELLAFVIAFVCFKELEKGEQFVTDTNVAYKTKGKE